MQPGRARLQPGRAKLQPGRARLQPGPARLQPGPAGLQPGHAGLQHMVHRGAATLEQRVVHLEPRLPPRLGKRHRLGVERRAEAALGLLLPACGRRARMGELGAAWRQPRSF